MTPPDRFGHFLLFHEEEANSYRTVHRAGRVQGRAVERIVRLELFDGPEIDTGRLIAALGRSASLQGKLSDPHIAGRAGIGEVGGVPFAAYDFELGTTLSEFLSVARRQSFPVPLDQALFIAERIALALAAAYQVEHDSGRVLHGFLTPESVLLSSEGEVKVGEFEVAYGLREQLADRPFCAPYCSPKSRTGHAPAEEDDVFSLGSILFELVTGESLSIDSVDLDRLTVLATGEPASRELRLLLEGSFAPRASRIPNVMAWQQELGRLILDGEYNPTTFNLAFLVHTLLRDELESGATELQREKSFLVPRDADDEATATASVPAAVFSQAGAEAPSLPQTDFPTTPAPAEPSESFGVVKPDARPFWLGFSVSAITVGAVLGAFLVYGGGADRTPAEPLAAPAEASSQISLGQPPGDGPPPSSPAAAVEAPATSSLAPELTRSQVVNGEVGLPLDEEELRKVVEERASAIESTLKAEYEQKLETLRAQMLAERQARPAVAQDLQPAETPEPGEPVGADPSDQDRSVDMPSVPTASSALSVESTIQPQVPATSAATTRTAAIEPEPLPTGVEEQDPASDPSPQAAALPEPAAPPGTETSPSNETSPPESKEAVSDPVSPPERTAQKSSAAQLIRLSTPSYPVAARRLGLSATARVRVRVSPEGRVSEAEIIGPPLGKGFDAAALAAVGKSRWKPALLNGEPVESWNALTIEFRP